MRSSTSSPMTGTREKPEREHSLSIASSVASRSMQIMSVRGTMISRVSVSDKVSTLRSISETSGSKSFDSTRRSMVARPCSCWIFSSSSSSDSSWARRRPSRAAPSRRNGVRRTAAATRRECSIMMSAGLIAPVSRGRTNTLTTATMMATTMPMPISIHTRAPHSAATMATSTPTSTLLAMRKNAHAPAVTYRSAMRRCTRWMRSTRFMRLNWVSSPSVCASSTRLLRLARVTLPTAPSAAARDRDSHTISAATMTSAAVTAIRVCWEYSIGVAFPSCPEPVRSSCIRPVPDGGVMSWDQRVIWRPEPCCAS